jgi:RNA polymerase sigma factor for flagellar operon FliA
LALIDPSEAPAVYQRQPARRNPAQMAQSHMPLVRKIAWHVHGRVSSAIDIEDLVQIGMMALVEAANGFEERGYAFSTYASMRVRGAMIDHLRRHATICRSAMVKRRELAKLSAELEHRLGRAPSEAEMAAALEMEPAAYRALADSTVAIRQESLDEVYSDQSMWFADIEDRADARIENDELKAALAKRIGELPEREALVLQLYFVEEMNLEEIGQTLGIGAARVCQIKKSALDRLRGSLSGWR